MNFFESERNFTRFLVLNQQSCHKILPLIKVKTVLIFSYIVLVKHFKISHTAANIHNQGGIIRCQKFRIFIKNESQGTGIFPKTKY